MNKRKRLTSITVIGVIVVVIIGLISFIVFKNIEAPAVATPTPTATSSSTSPLDATISITLIKDEEYGSVGMAINKDGTGMKYVAGEGGGSREVKKFSEKEIGLFFETVLLSAGKLGNYDESLETVYHDIRYALQLSKTKQLNAGRITSANDSPNIVASYNCVIVYSDKEDAGCTKTFIDLTDFISQFWSQSGKLESKTDFP